MVSLIQTGVVAESLQRPDFFFVFPDNSQLYNTMQQDRLFACQQQTRQKNLAL